MRTNVSLYYEPVAILEKLSDKNKSEMTERELAFLCGLIREKRPNKMVEIGVAAGGTSSVVLNCISMLGLETEMFSIDVSSHYYTNKNKKTGYLIDECIQLLNEEGKKPRHLLLTGKYAVEQMEKVGIGIDFLILDTVHSLPGEILDFLACYPLLQQKCVIVLHDIALNHEFEDGADFAYSYATKVLFDTITADKILDLETGHFPGIGAFVVTEDTDKYIEDVFSALTITWQYKPKIEELSLYRQFYSRHFSENNMMLYDLAVSMNYASIRQRWKDQKKVRKKQTTEFVTLYKRITELKSKRIYIYGYGRIGRALHSILAQCDIGTGIYHIVSDGQDIDEPGGFVYQLSEIEIEPDKDVIIVGVNESLQTEICSELEKRGFTEYILLERKILLHILAVANL